MAPRDDQSPASTSASVSVFTSDDHAVEIVAAVANRDGVHPTSLDPLYDAVDVEALGRLLASGSPTAPVEITFEYAGHDVHVSSDGTLVVT